MDDFIKSVVFVFRNSWNDMIPCKFSYPTKNQIVGFKKKTLERIEHQELVGIIINSSPAFA